LFLHGSGHELWIGTGHGPWDGDLGRIAPDESEIEQLLAGANAAAPALALRRDDVHRVLAGLLPAPARGSAALTQRATIVEHGSSGGPHGLVTAVGIKFTTARATALRALTALGVARSPAPAR
jgi:glycerol-3-phosphate dehydrogenase